MASPAVLANNAVITINSVDLSADLNQVSLNMTQGEIDTSTFGASGWKEFILSIAEATMDITGFFDKASAKNDATIFAMMGAPTTSVACGLKIPNSSTGSVNYTFNAWAKSYKVDGKVNDAAKMTAQLRITGAITRAVL
jgi:hypothetical protein